MSSNGSLRHVCSGCKQELSRSACYRHQNYPASCLAGSRYADIVREVVDVGENRCAPVKDSDLVSSHSTQEAHSSDQLDFEECVDADCQNGSDSESDETKIIQLNITEEQFSIDYRPNLILKAISFPFFCNWSFGFQIVLYYLFFHFWKDCSHPWFHWSLLVTLSYRSTKNSLYLFKLCVSSLVQIVVCQSLLCAQSAWHYTHWKIVP